MKLLIAALCLVLATASCDRRPAPAGETVTAAAWASIFPVENQFGLFMGTCWYAGEGLFVTAYHVVEGEEDIRIDGESAFVLAFNADADLAVVSSRPRGVALRLRSAQVGEAARARGYTAFNPLGCDRIQTTGTITSTHLGGWTGYDGGIQPGMSGCPVLGDDGRVIGVVCAAAYWGKGPFSGVNPTMGFLATSEDVSLILDTLNRLISQ